MVELQRQGFLERIVDKELIVRGIVFATCLAAVAYFGFSPRVPSQTQSNVPVKGKVMKGKSIDLSEDKEKTVITRFSDGYIHPQGNFTDYTRIMPTHVTRPVVDNKTSKKMFLMRGTKANDVVYAKAGKIYSIQINAPRTFKEMSMEYAGIRVRAKKPFADKKSKFLVSSTPVRILRGENNLEVFVKYLGDRGEDKYLIRVIGKE